MFHVFNRKKNLQNDKRAIDKIPPPPSHQKSLTHQRWDEKIQFLFFLVISKFETVKLWIYRNFGIYPHITIMRITEKKNKKKKSFENM